MAQGRCTGQRPLVFYTISKRGVAPVLLLPDVFFGRPYSGAHMMFFVNVLNVTTRSREVKRSWVAPATMLPG